MSLRYSQTNKEITAEKIIFIVIHTSYTIDSLRVFSVETQDITSFTTKNKNASQ